MGARDQARRLRIQVRVENNKVQIRIRRGYDCTSKFAEIAAEAKKLPDCLIDGEAVVVRTFTFQDSRKRNYVRCMCPALLLLDPPED